MTVTITPAGTRGTMRPRLPGPVQAARALPFVALVRLLGSTFSKMGWRILVLTTVGAKSGRERRAVLGYWLDEGEADGSILIVGSNAGAKRHPGWLFNMASHPDQVWIEGLGPKTRVQPETLEGEERARMWAKVASSAYRRYQGKTDREIPIVRLRPLSSG